MKEHGRPTSPPRSTRPADGHGGPAAPARDLTLDNTDVATLLRFAGWAEADGATFTEPIVPAYKMGDCPALPDGFCGQGPVLPFGLAQDIIHFGASCGGNCDFPTITLPQGVIYLDETFSDLACPGPCRPNPAEPISATLTDVIVAGTGAFQGATGCSPVQSTPPHAMLGLPPRLPHLLPGQPHTTLSTCTAADGSSAAGSSRPAFPP